jgi:hypothetical protein
MTELQHTTLAGTLKKMKSLKDGRLSIAFIADTPTEDQLMELAEMEGAQLWCQLSHENKMPVPAKAPPPLTGATSDSQRLRLALQSLWSNKYSDRPFEEWYHEWMSKVTNKAIRAANDAAWEQEHGQG